LADDTVDAIVALFTPPVMGTGILGARLAEEGGPSVGQAIAEAAVGSRKPIVATYLGAKGMPPELRVPGSGETPAYGSVPSYPAPEDAVRALSYVTRYAAWRRRPHGQVPTA